MLIVSGATTGRRKWPKRRRTGPALRFPSASLCCFHVAAFAGPVIYGRKKGHGHLLRTCGNDCGGIKGSPFYLTEKLRLKGYNTIPRDTEQLNKSFLQNLPEP